MSNDEQKDEIAQEVAAETPATTVPAEVDEVAVQLAVIESEKPSGEAAGNTPAAEAEPQSAEQANEPQLDEAKEPTTAALVNVPEPSQPKPSKVAGLFTSKKQAVIAAVMAGVLVLGGGAAAFALLYQAPVPEAQVADTTQVKQVAKMGVAVTLVDGAAEYQRGAGAWQALTADSQLKEGDAVRTADGRVVLTLDDGSALRLDANTTVGLTSLKADDIKIAQVDGTAYSRVVPSKRSYTVAVDGVNYTALGTAFSTIKSGTEKGVRVFQSSVRVNDAQTAVAEGKQYFSDSTNASLKAKITDIDIDAIADDTFVAWNLAQDEKGEQFKDKLGVLTQVKERATKKASDAAADKAKIEQEAAEKAKKSTQPIAMDSNDKKTEDSSKVTAGTFTLAVNSQGKATWSFSGVAPYGYKLVASKSHNPTYPESGWAYYSDSAATTGDVPAKEGKGTYYVRVCAYTNNTEDAPCVNYSSEVVYTKTK